MHIYILHHPLDKNYLKIGKSKKGSLIRADQLTRATGTAGKWEVIKEFDVSASDTGIIEKVIHHYLDCFKIKSEHFLVKLEYANIVCEKVIKSFQKLNINTFELNSLNEGERLKSLKKSSQTAQEFGNAKDVKSLKELDYFIESIEYFYENKHKIL